MRCLLCYAISVASFQVQLHGIKTARARSVHEPEARYLRSPINQLSESRDGPDNSVEQGHETSTIQIIEALFGSEDSSRAFARNDVAEHNSLKRFNHIKPELQYGEFALDFFIALLRRALPRHGEIFVDLGSGCGRLVLAAALLHRWRLCAGAEVLEDLHAIAVDAHSRLASYAEAQEPCVALSPCEFACDDATKALPHLVHSSKAAASTLQITQPCVVVFIYATCWPSVGPYLSDLSETLGTHIADGSRVITIDKQLVDGGSWTFDLIDTLDMPNYNTHESRGYVYVKNHYVGRPSRARN